jgi:hypothetical protein
VTGTLKTEPITVTVREFCRLAGIGRDKAFALIKDGTIDSFLCGGMRLISVDSYRRWVAEQVRLDQSARESRLQDRSGRTSLRKAL